ncbi:hypothetical protein BGZ97_005037 [Linnemannia gamsii]|uniref:F-box domain-containing protein n=1 Tax=Linnemannia gamsii TaxID=64522 RepID=A0A9P6QVV8_9FUNG|nr:hypothetical protein BGZ97_005037 [Linnemannia gamsii]
METILPIEVLIHVSEYLNPADLANACCVARAWFIPFASQLWRAIQRDQFSQEALIEALPRYSIFVRELHCSRFARLDRVGPECTRLCIIEAPVLGPAQGRQDGWAIEILERNPDLEEVSVWFPNRVEATRQLMRFIGIVVRMKKLKRLRIDGFMAPDGALEYLLEMLPGLEELTIELWQPNPDAVLDPDFVEWQKQRIALEDTEDRDDADAEQLSTPTPAVSAATSARPASTSGTSLAVTTTTGTSASSSPRQLRRLSLIEIEFSFEEFLNLVRDYPLLESIVLEGSDESAHFRPRESPNLIPFCEQLGVLCPRLDQLSLKSMVINTDGLKYLLSAFPRLKCLTLALTPMCDGDILQILLNHPGYSSTLEEIELTHDTPSRPSNVETLEVLRRFHRLRKLRVTYGKLMVGPFIQILTGSNDEEQPQQQEQQEQQEQQQQQQQHCQQQHQHQSATTIQDESDDLEGQGQIYATTPTRPGEFLEKLDVTIVGPSKNWAPPECYSSENDDGVLESEQHHNDEDDDVDNAYPLYITLTTLLREKTLLSLDDLVFDYIL